MIDNNNVYCLNKEKQFFDKLVLLNQGQLLPQIYLSSKSNHSCLNYFAILTTINKFVSLRPVKVSRLLKNTLNKFKALKLYSTMSCFLSTIIII